MSKTKKCGPCKKCAKKARKTRKKQKPEGPKMGAVMDPTKAWWVHERYVKRRTAWMWRLRPYILKTSEQCNTCQHGFRCHKIPLDEETVTKILEGKECPTYKSIWNKIVGDDEPYDWGF